MENNEMNLQEEPKTVQSETEAKEITPIPYEYVLNNFFESAKVLGQIAFVDNNTKEEALSNTISIIRMLSNGDKQFFKITVEETKEITIKK